MSSSRDPRSRSSRPNGTAAAGPSKPSSNAASRRSPPRDGYYAGGEFDGDEPPMTPTSASAGAGPDVSFPGDDIYASAAARHQQQQQQGPPQLRGGGGPPAVPQPPQGQQRMSAPQGASSRRGGDESPKSSRPQSYAGSLDYSPPRMSANAAPQPSKAGSGSGGHYRRPSGHSAPRSSANGGPPQHRTKQQQVTEPPEHLGPPQSTVSRLESPSIARSVLQPLEKKMNEYDRLMAETQAEVAQLDEELRSLQERRRRAEDKFAEAKAKHDEYERQHHDVGRALRGEIDDLPPSMAGLMTGGGGGGGGAGPQAGARAMSPPVYPQMHQPMSPPTVAFQDRPMSGHSSRSGQKVRTRDRFRMSLFGRG